MFLLEQIQAKECREPTLAELCSSLSQLDSRMESDIAEQLVETLRCIESPDDLYENVVLLEGLLIEYEETREPCLDSSAVLGLFARKILIKFHSYLFEGLSNLFNQVQTYITAFFDPDNTEASEESASHTELGNFVPYYAGLLETSPPSLEVIEYLFNSVVATPCADSWISEMFLTKSCSLTTGFEMAYQW